jgi:cysteine desulfurase/selenocysteine lyase
MTITTGTATELNVEAIRGDFPVLQRATASGAPLVYLDNGASTQHPVAVIEAMGDCYRDFYANVHRGIHTLSEESTRAFEVARDTVAQLLNAASIVEVIFTAGTTAAINTVARSWGDANVKQGDYILLTIAEHHANIVPWQQLAERTGCKIAFLPIDASGQISPDVVRDHLERLRPKMFAFMAVSNVLGTEFPVAQWTRLGHEFGAKVLVDAAQAVPHMPVDVQAWDADFVVFSGHKICGPTGIGILYGKESILESMPPFLGGGAMIRTVSTDGYVVGELPQKFEAGTPPIVEAIGLAAAIDYVRSVGLPAIHDHERKLARIAMDALSTVEGVRVFGPPADQRAGIVSFVIDAMHPHDISQWLDIRGIAVRAGHHCAMPLHHDLGVPASCRASFYFYNTFAEAENFGLAIAEMQKKFSRRRRS